MNRTKRESEEDFDADQDVLDRILNKLYDFGDGSDDKRSKKTHQKSKRLNDEDEEENVTKPNCDKDGAIASHVTAASTAADSRGLGRKAPDVEIVTFQDPRKKKKLKRAAVAETKPADGKEKEKTKKDPDVLSMEKARLDVHRFGITGFQKQQQRVFEQDRAIMLGATPPKKDYVNYKVFQQMIKEKKMKEKQEIKAETAKKKKKSPGKQKNVKRQSGAEPMGHVGRFKNGVLVLNSNHIPKLTGRVRK